ncbi:MAG TPA: hypothetical protein VMB48_10715 [Steroidobacteraceae bacterium]|nr:hypothetical protein [Steroidobacteraceae bacterium]
MPATPTRVANPFIYGRVLSSRDSACPRASYERAIEDAITNHGRLALVGDRRLGKSTLVERTHQLLRAPLLHWDFHKVYSAEDLVHRAAEDLERFVREISPIARKVTPWLREVGLGIQDIRLSYHGVGAALSTRMPTDHLKRLLGYVAEIAKRRSFSLFIDELQDVADRLKPREGEAILGLLRSELQRMRIACFFAGSSRESFRSLFISDSSPFYESARLLEVEPIPGDDFARYLQTAFGTGSLEASRELVDVLLAIGGQSPNDVQHLAHEVWNAARPGELTSRELRAALAKILADATPMAEAWIEKLTRNQTRVLLATALHEGLGYATEAFLSISGTVHRSAVVKALKPCLEGTDPLVEKVGTHFRIRNRFLRLWLCTRKILIQELIPQLRDDGRYRAIIASVCPQLSLDESLEK